MFFSFHLFLCLLTWISANLLSLIVSLMAFQMHFVHRQDHLETKVMLVAGIPLITILSIKTVTWKLLSILLPLLYLLGLCHYCMIWPSKWSKLVTNSSYSGFISKIFTLGSLVIYAYILLFNCLDSKQYNLFWTVKSLEGLLWC